MTTRLNIDLLRSFVAIAEARVMSRAASRVGRTQAALSQQVKRLETEVQQTLMIRSGRGITLTAQGERLFLHAQNILRTHDEAVGELLGLSLSGELRVGCPDDYQAGEKLRSSPAFFWFPNFWGVGNAPWYLRDAAVVASVVAVAQSSAPRFRCLLYAGSGSNDISLSKRVRL